MAMHNSRRAWSPRGLQTCSLPFIYLIILLLASVSYVQAQDSSDANSSTTESTPSHTSAAPNNSVTSSTHTATIASSSSSPSRSAVTSSSSATVIPTTLPQPFDTSLGSNFTATSCPTFFNTFLANSTFKSCLPMSLLLQNSMSFFQAMRSATLFGATVEASCSASLAVCSPLMSNIADELISDDNCGQDYQRQNPIVLQAYAGLVAYEPLYNATCLQDQSTGDYCFGQATLNATNSADLYPYYTALGMPLPSSAQPTCNSCLQRTMEVFAGYAKMKDQPLSRTYLGCASQVDKSCGSSFANTQVQVASESSSNSASSVKVSPFVIGLAGLFFLRQAIGL